MKRLAISILTPTYNRAHVLHRVDDNLIRQKTRDFDWVVVDDGSTDGTPALLERWQAEADFPISWYWANFGFTSKSKGSAKSRNVIFNRLSV